MRKYLLIILFLFSTTICYSADRVTVYKDLHLDTGVKLRADDGTVDLVSDNLTTTGTLGAGAITGTSLTGSGLSVGAGVYTTTGGLLTTTAPTTGALGYWTRSGTTISTATAGDKLTIGTPVSYLGQVRDLDVIGDVAFYKDSGNLATGDSSTFTGGIGAWTYWFGAGTLTAVGGKGVFSDAGCNYYLNVMETGTPYTLTMKIRRASGSGTSITLASGASGTITGITGTEQTFTKTFTATGSVMALMIGTGSSFEIDDVVLSGPTPGKWLNPGATTGVWQAMNNVLIADNGISIGTSSGIETTNQILNIRGTGDKANGLFYVQSASTNQRGTLGRFGFYSFWNMDNSGNTFWNWGARYDGTANQWIRTYTSANNYLPYTRYGTNSQMAFGGAVSNDKTNTTPTMADLFVFDVSTGNAFFGGSTTPAAKLHLAAGTATAGTAPLKLMPGTVASPTPVLTIPEVGTVEPAGDDIHYTIATGTARKHLVMDDGTVLTSGKIPVATTNGRLIDVTAQTELTDELTSITHTAPGTPDYAIQDLTNSSGYGFVTKDEGNTVLSVILNLQSRVNELETKLTALGLLADAD